MKKYIYYLVGILILAFAPGCIAHMPYDDSVAYKPDYRVNYYASLARQFIHTRYGAVSGPGGTTNIDIIIIMEGDQL